MINEREKILFLALCAYTYDSICDINFDNISCIGIGRDAMRKITEKLEVEGYIKNMSTHGFFNRYKMLKEEQCPEFIFDKIMTPGNKETIVRAMDTLTSYDKIPIKRLALQMYGNEEARKPIYTVKEKSGKTIFEHLQEIKYVKLKPTHRYPLIYTEFGMQVDNKEEQALIYNNINYECQFCGETDPSKMHSKYRCNKCSAKITKENLLENPGKFLLAKTHTSKNTRKRYIEHTLTHEEITAQLEKQDYKDYYTGKTLQSVEEMSVDRVDSSKGYTKDNIVITTIVHNVMKTNLSIPEFKEHITLLYNNLNNF